MAEHRLEGRRAVLVGTADAGLIESTLDALHGAGAEAEVVAAEDLGATSGFDICICFARPPSREPLATTDPDTLADHVAEALSVPQRIVTSAARTMAAAGGGAIVIVGSLDATHAYPRRAAASIAMGGLLGLVRAIAVEMSGAHVRANLILAGPMQGPVDERTLLRSPLGRLATAEEVAGAVRFLAGPDSDFMTGQAMRVDGGWASLNQAPDGMRFR